MYVKYPIMGLTYAHDYFAICGGGGSLKSGIPNSVDIYQLNDNDSNGFIKTMTIETGTELASGCAFSHDGDFIAVSVNDSCWIFELDKKAKTLTLLIKFRTDFAAVESTQTSASFVGNNTLLTGGEDGIVRVWALSTEPSAQDKSAGTSKELVATSPEAHAEASAAARKGETPAPVAQPSVGMIAVGENGKYMATLTREYRGHSKRIREIHVEPSHRNLVVSSSEDQSCHLWRLNERTTICRINKDDALDTAYQLLHKPGLTGIKKHQFRCVRFANDGRSLYTVLTPPRGDTLLLKWIPQTITQQNENEWLWTIAAATVTGDRPVAGLCVSGDDRFVSCAAVSGDVRVYESTRLSPYKMLSTEEHSFAITGMGFVPTPHIKQYLSLVTGGADKKLLRHLIPVTGGEITTGGVAFMSAMGRLVGGIVTLILSLCMGMTLLFVLLLGLHAKNSLLLRGPLSGYEDLVEFKFETPDALVTLVITTTTMLCAWMAFLRNSVTSAFFWNGILCLGSMLLSFFVAISPDLQLRWKTGDAPFDELLDYKISIILGACCIVFFFTHSILVKMRSTP